MSEDEFDIRAQLRAMQGGGESKDEADLTTRLRGQGFDPVQKIASILSRYKPLGCLGYFHDETFIKTTVFDGNRPPGRRARYLLQVHDPPTNRPFFGAATYAALEHLGAGIDPRTKKRYRFMAVLKNSADDEDAFYRMTFLRIWGAMLAYTDNHPADRDKFRIERDADGNEPYRPEWKHDGYEYEEKGQHYHNQNHFNKIVGGPLPRVVHEVINGIYAKHVMYVYRHQSTGDAVLDYMFRGKKDLTEEFQDDDTVQFPATTLMASHIIYDRLNGMYERLQHVKTRFDLALLVGTSYLRDHITDEQRLVTIDEWVGHEAEPRALFMATALQYHMAMMEGNVR